MIRVVAFLSIIVAGCYTQIDKSSGSSAPYLPHRASPTFHVFLATVAFVDSGSYYAYQFSDFGDRIEHVELMLSDLYSRGFNITRAWYSEGGSHNRTMVMPFFVINLADRNPEMERFNFRPIATPKGSGGVGPARIYEPGI
jgi:hypothetical protein